MVFMRPGFYPVTHWYTVVYACIHGVWHTLAMRDEDEQKQEQEPEQDAEQPKEIGGRKGPDPTRYGDWEKAGRCIDF